MSLADFKLWTQKWRRNAQFLKRSLWGGQKPKQDVTHLGLLPPYCLWLSGRRSYGWQKSFQMPTSSSFSLPLNPLRRPQQHGRYPLRNTIVEKKKNKRKCVPWHAHGECHLPMAAWGQTIDVLRTEWIPSSKENMFLITLVLFYSLFFWIESVSTVRCDAIRKLVTVMYASCVFVCECYVCWCDVIYVCVVFCVTLYRPWVVVGFFLVM